jgi:hypothetical protein
LQNKPTLVTRVGLFIVCYVVLLSDGKIPETPSVYLKNVVKLIITV